jgi:hypothetical protein
MLGWPQDVSSDAPWQSDYLPVEYNLFLCSAYSLNNVALDHIGESENL